MPRHKIMRKRLNKVAKELKVFTTKQMADRLNSYPNNEGKRVTKSPKVCMNRCHNLIRADKEIVVKERYTHSDTRTIWEYIGDEEK